MEQLATLYLPFSNLLNEIYEALRPEDCKSPPFSIARMMVVIWRRKVYEPLADQLHAAILEIFSELRMNGGNLISWDYEEIICSAIRGVEALVDLSVNEENIHSLETEEWVPVGPYAKLSTLLKESTMAYYTELVRT